MRRHANHADRPHSQQRQGQGVLSAVDLETFGDGGHQAGRLAHVARRILHGHHILDLVGQAEDGGRVDLATRPDRDVVEHHRQRGGLGYCPEVVEQPELRRTVVVRGDSEDGVGPSGRAPLGQLYGSSRVVASSTGDDVTIHSTDHRFHQGDLLVVGQGRRLAGRPGQHQTVVALLHQPAGQLHRPIQIQRPVGGKRSDHGGNHPTEPRLHLRFLLVSDAQSGSAGGVLPCPLDPQGGQQVFVQLKPHRVVRVDHRPGEPIQVPGPHPVQCPG